MHLQPDRKAHIFGGEIQMAQKSDQGRITQKYWKFILDLVWLQRVGANDWVCYVGSGGCVWLRMDERWACLHSSPSRICMARFIPQGTLVMSNLLLINSVNFACTTFDCCVTIAGSQGKVGFATNLFKGRNTLTKYASLASSLVGQFIILVKTTLPHSWAHHPAAF